jgi:hypothetical protein
MRVTAALIETTQRPSIASRDVQYHFFVVFVCFSSNTYRLIFAQMMLVQDLVYHLTIRHQNSHSVAPHFPILTDNPLHTKLVLLLILQRCNFVVLINNFFSIFFVFFCGIDKRIFMLC